MAKFNSGRPYHGSRAVERGKLRGATAETDYFYFFCPKCPGDEAMRILDYDVHAEQPENPYNEHCHSKAKHGFVLVFKLHCEQCRHTDFVKISNMAWQGGQHQQMLGRIGLTAS